jgi:tetratricopeptide (TPR) repeat protein
MKNFFLPLAVFSCYTAFSQDIKLPDSKALLTELSQGACLCVDSIDVVNKSKADISKEISRCIADKTNAYQLMAKLSTVPTSESKGKKNKKKEKVEISINMDESSDEFKKYYYEIERYMMDSCQAVKEKIASSERRNNKSFSEDPIASGYYSMGLEATKKEDFKGAVEYYKKALAVDPQFVFAWDNLGICYRRLGEYDNALNAYQKSLEIDSTGMMPLQNIAIVYQYKQEYVKAVEAYERMAILDKDNPEIYYGIGQIYASYLPDKEKALTNMCKAYQIYTAQKSPYRTDAEKLINMLYVEMKKQGKETRFREILKENNISMN